MNRAPWLTLSALVVAVGLIAWLKRPRPTVAATQVTTVKTAPVMATSTPNVPVVKAPVTVASDPNSQTPGVKLPPVRPGDEERARLLVRDNATRYVEKGYSLLLKHLGLPVEKEAGLKSLLIDTMIAGTTNRFQQGRTPEPGEREWNIAMIVGNAKMQEFLALEKKMPAYWEFANVDEALGDQNQPMSDSQRERMFDILVANIDLLRMPAAQQPTKDPLADVEGSMARHDEFERHVLEQAPSVLSEGQVRALFAVYDDRAEQRRAALEQQRRWRSQHPGEQAPAWYPAL